MTPVVLTIAGSDSGGGAGIQADLAAFRDFGLHGTSAVTAITAQNTVGIGIIHPVPPVVLAAQIEAVLSDFEVGAIKIGMVPDPTHARVIAERLARVSCPIVVDPVISATTGRMLGGHGTLAALREHLLPLAACLTPNLPEAGALLGRPEAQDQETMEEQARALLGHGPRHVLVKGGHGHLSEAIDILVSPTASWHFASPWVETANSHGTGCALSSAIAASLARRHPMEEAVGLAKAWLSRRLAAGAGLRFGAGSGPALAVPGG